MQKTREFCTCGGEIRRNEYGVGQCRKCLRVYDPKFRDVTTKEGYRSETGNANTRECAAEGKGHYFGYSLRSVYCHEKARDLPGTLSQNGETILRHALTGPQRVQLPRGVRGVKILSGSVIETGMDLNRRHPYLDLHPEKKGSVTVTIRARFRLR